MGFSLGLIQPTVGSGSSFPNWEITIKQQQNPTSFPLFSQFGNCKKFPVLWEVRLALRFAARCLFRFLTHDFLLTAPKSTLNRFEALCPSSVSLDFVVASLVFSSRMSEMISSSNLCEVLHPSLIFPLARTANWRTFFSFSPRLLVQVFQYDLFDSSSLL